MSSRKPYIFLIFLILQILSGCTKKKPVSPDGMLLIPAGEFIMGTDEIDKEEMTKMFGLPETWFLDEHPKQKLFLDSYFIDRYEVTMKKYKLFVEETGYPSPKNWSGVNYPKGSADYSVVFVNLKDAVSYAKWAGKRIPTEKEWEKAARGSKGNIYPWGNTFDISKANVSTSMNKKSFPKPVGTQKNGASIYGVYDMAGNVWEWTTSWYKPYPSNKYKNKLFGEKFKVLRGFSWYAIGHFPDETYLKIIAHRLRSSNRMEIFPGTRTIDVGFRCVKDIN